MNAIWMLIGAALMVCLFFLLSRRKNTAGRIEGPSVQNLDIGASADRVAEPTILCSDQDGPSGTLLQTASLESNETILAAAMAQSFAVEVALAPDSSVDTYDAGTPDSTAEPEVNVAVQEHHFAYEQVLERSEIHAIVREEALQAQYETSDLSSTPLNSFALPFRIICFKDGREWTIGIILLGEQNSHVSLVQNGVMLEKHESGYCTLNSLAVPVLTELGQTVVSFEQGAMPFVFKLRRGLSNFAVLTKTIFRAEYLVVVPSNWQRDEAIAGTAHVVPEATSVNDHAAHLFQLDGVDSKIAFRDDQGRLILLEQEYPDFELLGSCIADLEEEHGPLFALRMPQIGARNLSCWDPIRKIRLRRTDDSGSQRTTIAVDPSLCTRDVALPERDYVSGKYTLRLERDDNSLECLLPFRFARGLSEVLIDGSSPVPTSAGHAPCRAIIKHSKDVRIEVIAPTRIKCSREDQTTTVIPIAREPRADLIQIDYVDERGGRVLLNLRTHRIWWRFRSTALELTEWTDEPLLLNRNNLKAISTHSIELLLPYPRWSEFVRVGFDAETAKRYSVKVSARSLLIPLREFGDTAYTTEIGSVSLYVWLHAGSAIYETTVAQVRVFSRCKRCEYDTFQKSLFLEHLAKDHNAGLFRESTEGERSKVERTLPQAVYRCELCHTEIVVSNFSNPDALIEKHLRVTCQNADANAIGQSSCKQIAAREQLASKLSEMKVCKSCDELFEGGVSLDMAEHYYSAHRYDCYQIR